MPYIKSDREKWDQVVQLMVDLNLRVDGDLNYILFKYCKYFVRPSYNNYKNFCGELKQCATEIERRLLSVYEERKIQENGDV